MTLKDFPRHLSPCFSLLQIPALLAAIAFLGALPRHAYAQFDVISGTTNINSLRRLGTSPYTNYVVAAGTTPTVINVNASGTGVASTGLLLNFVGGTSTSTLNVKTSGTFTTPGLAVGYNASAGFLNLNGGRLLTDTAVVNGPTSIATVSSGTWTTGTLAVDIGTMNMSGGSVIVSSSLRTGASGTLNLSGGTLQVGTLSLGGSNTFSGTTGIASGTVTVGVGGTTGTVTGNLANASMVFNRSDASAYAGALSGSGALTKQGAGLLSLTGSNSYSGATTVSAGTLAVGNANALGSGNLAVNGGTLDLQGRSVAVAALSGSSAATITSSTTGSVTLTTSSADSSTYGGLIANGNGTIALTKLGTGTLSLTGSNTYSGVTTVSAGALSIGSGGTTGSIAGNVVNNAALLFNRSNDLTYSGAVSGSGALTKQGAGKLTLAGANSYSGATTIAGGTIALSGSGTIGTGRLNLGTTGSAGVLDVSAIVGGTYALPATADLTGVGTLAGNGKTFALLGSLAPGNSTGTLSIGTGLALDLSNSVGSFFEIGSPAYSAGTYDLVNGGGSVIFGGILNLDFSGGTYADGWNVLQLFANLGGFSGNFTSVLFTGLADGQEATFNAATGFISIGHTSPVPEIDPSSMGNVVALVAGALGLLERRRLKAKLAV